MLLCLCKPVFCKETVWDYDNVLPWQGLNLFGFTPPLPRRLSTPIATLQLPWHSATFLSSRLALYSKEGLAFEDPSSTALVANKSFLIRDFAASRYKGTRQGTLGWLVPGTWAIIGLWELQTPLGNLQQHQAYDYCPFSRQSVSVEVKCFSGTFRNHNTKFSFTCLTFKDAIQWALLYLVI